ncbi:hypothetical protein Prudu_62S000300, partial [Prunus dulcis]
SRPSLAFDVATATTLGTDLRRGYRWNRDTTAVLFRPTPAAGVPESAIVADFRVRTSNSNFSFVSPPNRSSKAPEVRSTRSQDLRRVKSWTDVYGHPVRFQFMSVHLTLPHELRGRSDRECQDCGSADSVSPRPARIADQADYGHRSTRDPPPGHSKLPRHQAIEVRGIHHRVIQSFRAIKGDSAEISAEV